MTKEEAALIVSFIAMALVFIGYFLKNKSLFLTFQTGAVFFLLLSYFFTGEYFAMIGMGISLVRLIIYFYYEKKMQVAPLSVLLGVCIVSICSYFIVNLWILKDAKPLDILCLFSLIMFSVAFRIRDLTLMRRVAVIPIACALVYNIFANSTPFIIISYSLELTSNVAAIIKFEVCDTFKLRRELKEKKE